MPVIIDNLQVTVRVTTAPRTRLTAAELEPDQNQFGQRYHLLPRPRTQDALTASTAPTAGEHEPEPMEWAAEKMDLYMLSDRVYDFMREDLRVDLERHGRRR